MNVFSHFSLDHVNDSYCYKYTMIDSNAEMEGRREREKGRASLLNPPTFKSLTQTEQLILHSAMTANLLVSLHQHHPHPTDEFPSAPYFPTLWLFVPKQQVSISIRPLCLPRWLSINNFPSIIAFKEFPLYDIHHHTNPTD